MRLSTTLRLPTKIRQNLESVSNQGTYGQERGLSSKFGKTTKEEKDDKFAVGKWIQLLRHNKAKGQTWVHFPEH